MVPERDAQQIVKRINHALRSFFSQATRAAGRQHRVARQLVGSVGEFTLRPGAKRTRGLLVVTGYVSNPRRKVDRNILLAAAAYEVLHAYLLIHDDIIDEDNERRGKPTLHRLFERSAPSTMPRSAREKIGRDIAIIAGDVAADMVQRILLASTFTDKQKLDALQQMERTLQTTYAGQVLDILSVPQRPLPRSDQILRYELKTAQYSIMGPYTLGATLGTARYQTAAFRRFATAAGVAFQLADDVENVFGTGLAARSSDVRSGKVTLLVTLALQSATYRDRILRLLRQPKRTGRDIARLRQLITESGGLDRARQFIDDHYSSAARQVPRLNISARSQALLEYLVERFRRTVS